MKFWSFIVLVGFFALQSCSQKDAKMHYNLSLEEAQTLAEQEDKPFCMLLLSNACPPCKHFLQLLNGKMKSLTHKGIFNVVNTTEPENQWYQQWICSGATPTTCVFSSSGKLTAVISGSNEMALNCLSETLSGNTACAEYVYSSPLIKSRKPTMVIESLNKSLQWKNKIDAKEDIDVSEMNKDLRRLNYPFNLYLKMMYEYNQGNNEVARVAAENLLNLNDPFYMRLYSDLFFKARKVIDPDFSEENAPKLTPENNKIALEGCKKGEAKPFIVSFKNTGKTELQILQIQKSCTCLSFHGDETYSIPPDGSLSLKFEFLPEEKGKVAREITFISNAINHTERIDIIANVN